MIWFPIKDRAVVARFYRQTRARRSPRPGSETLCGSSFGSMRSTQTQPLAGNGLALVNPPYVLEGEARLILPYLAQILATSNHAGHAIARF